MRAGTLRKRLKLQRRSSSIDDHGGQVFAWTDLDEVWGEIVPSGGAERAVGEEIRDIAQHMITIRYYPGLTPKDRVFYRDKLAGRDRIFNITNVENVEERNHFMQLTATEGANLG